MSRPLLVLMAKGRWVVIRQGSAVPLGEHDLKRDAVRDANALARIDGAKVIVFDVGVGDLPGNEPGDGPPLEM